MNEEQYHRLKWMTDDQWECLKLLGDVHGGLNHVFGKVQPSGSGIMINSTNSHNLATYDFSGLTILVVLAHDRMIRVQVKASGPNMIKIILHKRKRRDGDPQESHPTLEQAVNKIRSNLELNG